MKTISSRHNTVVQAFRELARTPDATGTRLLLDGVHLIEDAHRAGHVVETLAVAASRSADTEEGALARTLGLQGHNVLVVSDRTFAAMSPVRAPSGIVAIVRHRPADSGAIGRREHGFVVIADQVQDPGNVGAIIRAAEAGGATGALMCGASASPFSWKAIRGSMGSILRFPVAAGMAVSEAIDNIHESGGRVIAAARRGGRPPEAMDWRGHVALLVGGEGAGLDAGVLARADDLVTIPMASPVESLNVAVAAALLVYAARRQRIADAHA